MSWWPFSKRPAAIAMPDCSTSVSDAARILASTRKRWIPPGIRAALERANDYPDYSHLFPEPEGSLL